MAYRLKKVSYRDNSCHILLQNENGPCPLIAAANALLLRGALSLDPSTIRANVISIEDLTSSLADFALQRNNVNVSNNDKEGGWKKVGHTRPKDAAALKQQQPQEENQPPNPTAPPLPAEEEEAIMMRQKHQERHVDEMMSLLPGLQYGLDLNPKFTQGPDGCEYTVGLTTFDVLGVDLVHGWLVDPQDASLHSVLQGKSYNALVDLVIQGNEASAEVESLTKQIAEKERQLDAAVMNGWVDIDKPTAEAAAAESDKDGEQDDKTEAETGTKTTTETKATTTKTAAAETPTSDVDKKEEPLDATPPPSSSSSSTTNHNLSQELTNNNTNTKALEEEIATLQTKRNQAHSIATRGQLINNFLNETGHQLTYYGLEQLHSYLADYQLCVFFRNNHFSTLTKQDGTLFLLVTDLGYASVNDVVWERLDGIDGDSDYVDCHFARTKPKSQLGPTAPILSPEQVLSQKGQHELDYQLAVQLQGGNGTNGNAGRRRPMTDAAIADEEAALIAAATEESLNTYHHGRTVGGTTGALTGGGAGTVVALPDSKDNTTTTTSSSTTSRANSNVSGNNNNNNNNNSAEEEADRAMAMALQAQMESEDASVQLARRLQAEEEAQHGRRVQQQRQQRQQRQQQGGPTAAAAAQANNCVIS